MIDSVWTVAAVVVLGFAAGAWARANGLFMTRRARSLRLRRLVVAVVLLGIAAVAWVVVTGLMARSQLEKARAEVSTVKQALIDGDTATARHLAADLASRASTAHARTSGPAWWAVAHLPWIGRPAATVRDLTAGIDQIASAALPAALNGGVALAPKSVIAGPGQLDLRRIAAAAPSLTRASTVLHGVQARLQDSPSSTWLHVVDDKRRELLDEIAPLYATLDDGARAARLLPPMLGASGPRNYFVAFQNPAEARGLGGLVGAYGILTARDGKLSFSRFGTDADFQGARAHVHFGSDFDLRYGSDGFASTSIFVNSNYSPHLPYDAGIWLSMWQSKMHTRLDGVIVTDPQALALMLGVTGPVTLSDGQQLDGGNAAAVLESGVYAKFPSVDQNDARKAYLIEAARAVAQHITASADANAHALVTAMGTAVGQGRMLVYSAHPAEERELAATPLAGLLSDTKAPYAGFVVNNAAGTKLDYYLDRSLTYRRSTCDAARATVTVKLRNDTPASGLPRYVAAGDGTETIGGPLGSNVELLSLYVTHGASVQRIRVDGKQVFLQEGSERGHPVVTTSLHLGPGQSRTVTYTVREPAASGAVVVPVQPLARPMAVHVHAPYCK